MLRIHIIGMGLISWIFVCTNNQNDYYDYDDGGSCGGEGNTMLPVTMNAICWRNS